jgi:hypothetical protein
VASPSLWEVGSERRVVVVRGKLGDRAEPVGPSCDGYGTPRLHLPLAIAIAVVPVSTKPAALVPRHGLGVTKDAPGSVSDHDGKSVGSVLPWEPIFILKPLSRRASTLFVMSGLDVMGANLGVPVRHSGGIVHLTIMTGLDPMGANLRRSMGSLRVSFLPSRHTRT